MRRLMRKDGTLFWGSVRSVIQVAEDGTIQFINVVEDITELKQAKEALKRKVREVLDA